MDVRGAADVSAAPGRPIGLGALAALGHGAALGAGGLVGHASRAARSPARELAPRMARNEAGREQDGRAHARSERRLGCGSGRVDAARWPRVGWPGRGRRSGAVAPEFTRRLRADRGVHWRPRRRGPDIARERSRIWPARPSPVHRRRDELLPRLFSDRRGRRGRHAGRGRWWMSSLASPKAATTRAEAMGTSASSIASANAVAVVGKRSAARRLEARMYRRLELRGRCRGRSAGGAAACRGARRRASAPSRSRRSTCAARCTAPRGRRRPRRRRRDDRRGGGRAAPGAMKATLPSIWPARVDETGLGAGQPKSARWAMSSHRRRGGCAQDAAVHQHEAGFSPAVLELVGGVEAGERVEEDAQAHVDGHPLAGLPAHRPLHGVEQLRAPRCTRMTMSDAAPRSSSTLEGRDRVGSGGCGSGWPGLRRGTWRRSPGRC